MLDLKKFEVCFLYLTILFIIVCQSLKNVNYLLSFFFNEVYSQPNSSFFSSPTFSNEKIVSNSLLKNKSFQNIESTEQKFVIISIVIALFPIIGSFLLRSKV